MFEQKYGVKPNRFLFWFGIYLGSIIFAYVKLFHDVPIAFWTILILENILTITLQLDQLMDEAMEEVTKGFESWVFVGGTLIGTIALISLFFVEFRLAMILAVTEVIVMIFNKIKSNQHIS